MSGTEVDLSPWKIRRGPTSLDIAIPLLAAPMAGGLDPPFRMILHDHSCPLSFTEMVSARAVRQGTEKTLWLFEWVPEKGLSGAQIFGSDPELLGKGASQMEARGHHVVDLNLGCPKRKVTRLGAGAAMLKDPENLMNCIRRILDSVSVPVGVKMRSGIARVDRAFLRTLVRELEGLGISYIALHPRTQQQQYSGRADRELISLLSAWVDIPVLASGDVKGPEDVTDYLHRGATAVMAARGMLGDPTWIKRCLNGLKGDEWVRRYPSTREAVEAHMGIARIHLDKAIRWYGEEKGTIEFRPHLSWYVKNFKGRAPFRDRLFTTRNSQELLELIDEMEASWKDSV